MKLQFPYGVAQCVNSPVCGSNLTTLEALKQATQIFPSQSIHMPSGSPSSSTVFWEKSTTVRWLPVGEEKADGSHITFVLQE